MLTERSGAARAAAPNRRAGRQPARIMIATPARMMCQTRASVFWSLAIVANPSRIWRGSGMGSSFFRSQRDILTLADKILDGSLSETARSVTIADLADRGSRET